MQEVAPNLHVGNETDFENTVKSQSDWAVVHIRREPSQGLKPDEHPGYSAIRRDTNLVLNIDDAEDPADISKQCVDAALHFIGEHLPAGKDVLVYSPRGASRSAGIVLLYLAVSRQLPCESLEAAEAAFSDIYPSCALGAGMRGFLERNWSAYVNAGPSPLAHERLL